MAAFDTSKSLSLSSSLAALLHQSDVLWKGPFASSRLVSEVGPKIVVKIVPNLEDLTEYTTLQFLEKHKPNIPAPRPLGVISQCLLSFIFMSYMPATTLRAAWPYLNEAQKSSVQDQLDEILTDLRSLPYPEGQPLGGVAGEGCKDIRRDIRKSAESITSSQAFEDFQSSNPHFGSSIFIAFLRQLSPITTQSKCVFTPGDVRPDNITVELTEDGNCVVTGLDWEASGFYPEHFESTKITSCMATNADSDWYMFLPPSISPTRHPTSWLLDRVWDRHVE